MKTKAKLLGFFFLLLISSQVFAQTKQKDAKLGSLTGILVESGKGTGVEFANVVLYRAKDSVMVSWAATDANGAFNMQKIPLGKYALVAKFMGFKKMKIDNLSFTATNLDQNLGSLQLLPDQEMLNEVVVTADKKAVETQLDKKVINVAKDLTSTGGTAVDVLKNVPSVSVDVDGGVSLRGNSNVNLLIDGRPSSIGASRLDQIPSSDIESIEVITNPSAKYNPEGLTGIINIKLKKKRKTGTNGLASISVGTHDKYSGSINLNRSFGDVTLHGSYNAQYKQFTAERYLFRTATENETAHFLTQNAKTGVTTKTQGFKLGLDYQLNPKNSLSISWFGNMSNKLDSDFTHSAYSNISNVMYNQCVSYNSEKPKEFSSDYALSYKKTFDKKGEELTLDYGYSFEKENQDQPQKYVYPDSIKQFEMFTNTTQYNSNLQINWVLSISESSQLEAGVQSVFRGNDDQFQQSNFVHANWSDDASVRNSFKYDEKIQSVYGTWTGKYKTFSYMAGARLEQTNTFGKQSSTGETISQNYFNLYPTLHISQKLGTTQELMLSYSRRIERPNSGMLNPFVDRSNPDALRTGNPDLKPEYINSYEAGYSQYWDKGSMNATIFYKRSNNAINRIVRMDSLGVSHMRPENESLAENYGLELVGERSLFKWWKLSGNLSFFKYIITGAGDMSKSNFTSTARLQSSWTPVKSLSFQLSGSYRGPQVGIQSESKALYSTDFAMNKDFWNDQFSFTLRLSDIFNTMKNSYTTWGDNFTADNWRKKESRVLYLVLTYKIGKQSSNKGNRQNTNQNEGGGGMDF